MKRSNEGTLFAILILVGLVGGVLAFPLDYFRNSNVWIGLCMFPFTLFIEGRKRVNFVYAGLAVMFATLASIYGVRIFYFFSIAFYFLWLIEFFLGALNVLVLFLVLLASPFFIQVVTILGFPLRLMLSEYAGFILNLIGKNVRVEGNMMILNNLMFSVDEACMGLNMLAISMLMAVSVLIYRYRLYGRLLGLGSSVAFFGLALALNVTMNLIRIMALVYFEIPPDDLMHEIVGILCLLCYVVIPLYFFGAWFIQKFGESKDECISHESISPTNILLFILPFVVLTVGSRLEKSKIASTIEHADLQFTGGAAEQLSDGITKISTEKLLIYVKSIPDFFTGEHTPLMCWKGSGYEFSGITTITVAGVSMYKGTLVRDENTLFTAWWYSNGEVNTISQLDWRLRMLCGEEKFCLVNVTAKSEQTLNDALASIFKNDLLVISPHHRR